MNPTNDDGNGRQRRLPRKITVELFSLVGGNRQVGGKMKLWGKSRGKSKPPANHGTGGEGNTDTHPDQRKKTGSSGQTLRILLGVGLLVVVVTTIIVFLLSARLSTQDNEYLDLLNELKVLSQQMGKNGSEAARGRHAAFSLLKHAHDSFAESLTSLRDGGGNNGRPASPKSVSAEFHLVQTDWQTASSSIDTILEVESPVVTMHEEVNTFDEVASELIIGSDELVNAMVAAELPPDQVYIAARQLMLIQRIATYMRRTLEGGEGVVTAADRFGRDAVLFGQVLNGFLDGDTRLGIERLSDEEAREILEILAATFQDRTKLIGGIMENSVELFQLQEATTDLANATQRLLIRVDRLAETYSATTNNRLISPLAGGALGIFAVLILIVLSILQNRETQIRAAKERQLAAQAGQREEETRQTNQRNQESILRLLDEISDLADGDLTTRATVTEEMTGAIADAVNYAIDALREVVVNINRTSVQVAGAAQKSRRTAIELDEANERQARKIGDATESMTEMLESAQRVSANAQESNSVAERSVHIAKQGAEAVRDTISGMEDIRENMQETSKRIKRLGESSQEIGDIVGLIDDIADQTNILALNAAIQASMAGDAGRGFAVVADEVQRLAERAGQATKQIEALVKTIQSDTNEAVISMEQSTLEVVGGAKIAQGAGESLSEIETVSVELAGIIDGISEDAGDQSRRSEAVTEIMNEIQGVTEQTLRGTRDTAASIGNLAELANVLKESVAGFQLPPEDELSNEPAPDAQPAARVGLG